MIKDPHDHRPACYSPTDELETEAVDILKRLLDHKYVKADIRERDKGPNIDGYLELVDEESYPYGKLEVQVKRMPEGNIDRPRHLLPISLIEYAKGVTNNPILFISVDCCNSVAYWHEVSPEALSPYSEKIRTNKDTFTLIFPRENRIDSQASEYVQAWKEIHLNRKTKLFQNDELRKQIAELRERSHPLLGETCPEFVHLHSFIDEVNRLIETEFPVIKRARFDNCWKLGISYNKYSEQTITYGIYPIPSDKNDLQIMQLPDDYRAEPIPDGVKTISTVFPNPIQKEPRQHAVDVVKEYIDDILKARLLKHAGNDFLAREFLFELIDRLGIPMGLEGRDRVRVHELFFGFYVRLPFWVDEAWKYLHQDVSRYPMQMFTTHRYRRPAMIIPYIRGEARESIEQKVEDRINGREAPPNIRMGDEEIPFGIAHEFLIDQYSSSDPMQELVRVYPKKNHQRTDRQVSWIWDVYSEEELGIAMTTFFDNLPSVYAFMLNRNFPEISTTLSRFTGVSKIVIFYKPSDNEDLPFGPSFEFFPLKGERVPDLPEVHVLPSTEKGDFSELQNHPQSGPEFVVQGNRYRCERYGSSLSDFLFRETPMLNYIYHLFEHDLKKYFKNHFAAS